MKKIIIFSFFFLFLNGLYATEEPTYGSPEARVLRRLCDVYGGESCARFLEQWAQSELAEVRRVRRLIGKKERDSFIRLIMRDCFSRQDRALRFLGLLQAAGYPSEAQRR